MSEYTGTVLICDTCQLEAVIAEGESHPRGWIQHSYHPDCPALDDGPDGYRAFDWAVHHCPQCVPRCAIWATFWWGPAAKDRIWKELERRLNQCPDCADTGKVHYPGEPVDSATDLCPNPECHKEVAV